MPKLSEMDSGDIKVVSAPPQAQAALRVSDLNPDDFHVVSLPQPVEAPKSIGAKALGVAGDAYKGLLSVVSGGGDSIGSRIPFIGSLGKNAGERFRAGVDYVAAGGDKPYSTLLQHIRDQEAADQDRFAEEHPGANAMRNVLGAAGSLAIPVPGAGIPGLAGVGARIAGAYTGGGTDILLRTEDPEKMRQAATLSGGIQTAFEALGGLGKVAAPLFNKAATAQEAAAEGLEGAANTRAVKAATGQNKAVLKQIAKTKGIDEVGQTLLSGEEPVVQFGSTVTTIRDRAAKAADQTWDKIEQVYQQADQAAGGKAIDGKEIADAIRQKATTIEPLPMNESTIASMNKTADYLEKKGAMTLSHAQDLKNNFIFKMSNPQTHALGLDGNNQIRQAFTETMGAAIERTDPALAAAWRDSMDKYGAYAVTSGAAGDRAVANISNRFISPSDYAAGIGGALLAHGGSTDATGVAKGLTMTVLSLAHKQLRERGSSMAASTMSKLADVLERNPAALGHSYDTLVRAAENGPAALEATHLMLMQSHPDYRKLMEPQQQQTVPGPLLVAPPRDPVQQKRDAIQRRIGE